MKLFDFTKFSLQVLTPIPQDVTEGMVLSNSFLSIAPAEKNRVKYKSGLGGEVLISETLNPVHLLTLRYLPDADAVRIFDLLYDAKTQFGVTIQNNSAPRYMGGATNCRFVEFPLPDVGGEGFRDDQYVIIMTDYKGKKLPSGV